MLTKRNGRPLYFAIHTNTQPHGTPETDTMQQAHHGSKNKTEENAEWVLPSPTSRGRSLTGESFLSDQHRASVHPTPKETRPPAGDGDTGREFLPLGGFYNDRNKAVFVYGFIAASCPHYHNYII